MRKIASLDSTSLRAIRPSFPREPYVHPEAMLIIQQCWSETPDQRPNIRRVKKVVETTLRTRYLSIIVYQGQIDEQLYFSSGTITDHMMKMMEEYAGNLEKIVHERTAMLEETQQQAEGLLLQMLPK